MQRPLPDSVLMFLFLALFLCAVDCSAVVDGQVATGSSKRSCTNTQHSAGHVKIGSRSKNIKKATPNSIGFFPLVFCPSIAPSFVRAGLYLAAVYYGTSCILWNKNSWQESLRLAPKVFLAKSQFYYVSYNRLEVRSKAKIK